MVRSGPRPGQVISSGRQPGSAKLTNGKKGTYQRKIARFNADSGCSIQFDSESQTETVQGLDGCASLMRDILRNGDSGSEIVSSESRYNYRHLDGKKYASKKKGHTAPSAVRKEILSSDNKKLIPNETSAGSKRDTSDIAQNWSLQEHYRMYSPIIYQALCEHVQTQMSLMNNLASKDGPNGIPTVPSHTMSGSESRATAHSGYGCSASTSVWSPQQLSCPVMVHSEVQTDGDHQLGSQEDSEVQRLVAEVETCISGLLATSGNTNIQVEIALAMQPLRSENAQLRRQLRTLNQHLREQEKPPKVPGNLELFPLQSLNMSLQNQLQESLKSQELLQNRNEELLKVIENQRDENKKFTSIFKDKEQTLLQNKQQFDIEMTRVKMELEESLANEKNSRFKLETVEKENQILGITLRQRDAEVTRLRELTRTLQNSMAKLLSDLSVDTACCKSGKNLTKSLLNIYDKQLQQDPTPPHTSVMSYLNKLETNHSFTHSELLPTVKNEETIEPDRLYEHVLPSQNPPHGNTRAEDRVSEPGIVPTFLEQSSDTECETITLIEDESNLDNTLYIPFARSTSKKHSPLSQRLSPQPKISITTAQLVSNNALASKRENKLCAPVVSSSQNEAEDEPGKLARPFDTEDMQLLRKIKEAIGKIPAATEDPKEQAAHHDSSASCSPGVQVKGNIVCDSSFLNSDLMSDWSISSFSTFTSHDEQDFRNGLAALDANIARLQKSLRTDPLEK
ncbi:coiled-coil domain-containing protein 14 isoform X3 [Nannospalax galili]|uniref:coiled-coil domain-containing protein 14 isoform X3 n=1 Tax=Nannospalax galili TaxID=1026970 RepID=UPI00111C4606|nr:coiled-coil domain-containing protein 14 isoform X3 [Nannospalax galili]